VLIVPLLTFLLVTLASSPAQAHNVLTGSDPKGGTTLPVLPDRVTLTFDQSVRRDFARIAVTGPDGAHYEQGEVGVDGTSVYIGTRRDGPQGAYEIGYRIVSNDGHPVTGAITFTVTGGGQATAATPQPSAAGSPVVPPAELPPSTVAPGATASAPPSTSPTPGLGVPGGQASPGDPKPPAPGQVPAAQSGGWVWGLLVATAVLLTLAALVLVRHDRRLRSPA
jgi:methionine-rich copper-binding protein CopC